MYNAFAFFGIVITTLIFTAGGAVASESPRTLPDLHLEVTARQRSDGKLQKGLHYFTLACMRQECTLTTLTLNQCGNDGAFFPKIEKQSTAEGILDVQRDGDVIVAKMEFVDAGGKGTTTLRFGIGFNKGSSFGSRVKSFSGAYIKDSEVAKSILTAEYIPLKRSLSRVKLDCNTAILPGVEVYE